MLGPGTPRPLLRPKLKRSADVVTQAATDGATKVEVKSCLSDAPPAAHGAIGGNGMFGAVGKKRNREELDGRLLRLKYIGPDAVPSDNLYITGIPSSIDKDSLIALFAEHGFAVQRARIKPDALGTGYSAGMVQLASQEEAAAAIDLFSGTVLNAPSAPVGKGASAFTGSLTSWTLDAAFADRAKSLCVPGVKGSPIGGSVSEKDEKGSKGSARLGKGDSISRSLSVKFNGRDNMPSDNLYIYGLHPGIQEHALKEIFQSEGFGVKQTRIIADTRGAGVCAALVRLASVEEASSAIQVFNGRTLQAIASQSLKKALLVKYAGKENVPSSNVYMSNVPVAIDQMTLHALFTNAGCSVVRSRMMYDAWGTGYNAAMIELGSQPEAAAAIEAFNGQVLNFDEATAELTLSSASPQNAMTE